MIPSPSAEPASGRRIRVLVVDDSVVIRRLVTDILSADPDVEVVGTAANGRLALAKLAQLRPDIITLDIEMPEMDGLTALRALRVDHPRLPVIMFSTLTERGARATLDALAAGASDYVSKPANVGSIAESMATVSAELLPRIRALAGRPRRGGDEPVAASVPRAAPAPARRAGAPTAAPRVVAIGCSTGGPQALTTVLQQLPAGFPLPVVVVQHMPPVFTAQFAARLDRNCAVHVVEAAGDETLAPGTVYLAPGDHHLEVVARGFGVRTRLNQGAPVSFCRPSVDVLFGSVTATFGGAVLGVILTGMGQDGREGCRGIVERGGRVIVQDERTSVVWGMPGSVASAGLADSILPLPEIGPAIQRYSAPGAARPAPSGEAR